MALIAASRAEGGLVFLCNGILCDRCEYARGKILAKFERIFATTTYLNAQSKGKTDEISKKKINIVD